MAGHQQFNVLASINVATPEQGQVGLVPDFVGVNPSPVALRQKDHKVLELAEVIGTSSGAAAGTGPGRRFQHTQQDLEIKLFRGGQEGVELGPIDTGLGRLDVAPFDLVLDPAGAGDGGAPGDQLRVGVVPGVDLHAEG